MPTLVRVRGKKGQSKLIKESKRKRVMEEATAVEQGIVLPPKPKSFLNNLPTEIIEEIFVYSLNFSLPIVSRGLYVQLNSMHTKRLFVQCFFTTDYDRDIWPDWELARVQTELLRLRWLTYSFLRSYQKEYLLKRAKELLRWFVEDDVFRDPAASIEGLPEATAEMETCFSRCFDLGHKFLEGGCGWWRYLSFPWDGPSDEYEFQYIYEHNGGKAFFYLRSDKGDYCNLWADDESAKGEYSQGSDQMPNLAKGCLIPQKLLHGPWTQARGDFIMLLLAAGARFDRTDLSAYEAGSAGLHDALHEGCYLAVWVLMNTSSDYVDREKERTIKGSKYPQLVAESKFPPDPEGPWIHQRDDYKPEKGDPPFIEPTPEHCLESLRAAEKFNDPHFRLFRWLLCFAIQTEGVEQVVLEWAAAKMAREEKEGVTCGLGMRVLEYYKVKWQFWVEEGKDTARWASCYWGSTMNNKDSDDSSDEGWEGELEDYSDNEASE